MQRLLIIGAGFAGMYAALAAARLRHTQGVAPESLEIIVVAPTQALVVRPRLYESSPERMVAPLGPLFEAVDVRFEAGFVKTIDPAGKSVLLTRAAGSQTSLVYDRLVLAAGSQLYRPGIRGLAEHAFSVDQVDDAIALDRHLQDLTTRPAGAARNTVVVAGGGFTGIEVASELPSRLRGILGDTASIRVIIADSNPVIAPAMGPKPRPIIECALRTLGVETLLGVGVSSVDESRVALSDGQVIDTATVIWAAGMRASPLTAQIHGERDRAGRLLVDQHLRVVAEPSIFAAGDTARAATDTFGNFTLMSCQHANRLGAAAGHNATADLLGVPPTAYQQKNYVTCLDLGPEDAVFTRGWDSTVELTGEQAKAMKREINTQWIYPPRAERAAAFEAAEWARLVDY